MNALNHITHEEVLDGFLTRGRGEATYCLARLAYGLGEDCHGDNIMDAIEETLEEEGVTGEDVDLAVELFDRQFPNAEAALLGLRMRFTPKTVQLEKNAARQLGRFIVRLGK
jgi:hypothetical protein